MFFTEKKKNMCSIKHQWLNFQNTLIGENHSLEHGDRDKYNSALLLVKGSIPLFLFIQWNN